MGVTYRAHWTHTAIHWINVFQLVLILLRPTGYSCPSSIDCMHWSIQYQHQRLVTSANIAYATILTLHLGQQEARRFLNNPRPPLRTAPLYHPPWCGQSPITCTWSAGLGLIPITHSFQLANTVSINSRSIQNIAIPSIVYRRNNNSNNNKLRPNSNNKLNSNSEANNRGKVSALWSV